MSSTCRHLILGVGKDNFQQFERAEWNTLNKLLQQRGFKPIHLEDPQTYKDQRDVVVLERQSAVEIRKMVQTLMKDTERRQTLICDLIQSNKELKNDLRQQQSKTSAKVQRTSNLEQVRDAVELKVQEVKGDYFAKCCQLQKQIEQLQQDKQHMQERLHQLKQKLREQEKTIVRLRKKLYMVVIEEEQHIERQNKVFLQFRKQTAGADSIPKQQLLDIIDAYETQIHCLQKELSTLKNNVEDVSRERKKEQGNNNKHKYSVLDEILEDKVLIKTYKADLKETKSRNHQNLKQVQKSFSGSSCQSGNNEEFISNKVEDLDCMQEATCKRLLKGTSPQMLEAIISHFQKLFDVSSVNGIYPRMNEVYSKLGEMNNAMKNLRQVLGLAESTPPSVLVNMVGKLCSSVNADTCRQVQQLLGTQDIDSIITKLEEHEEFFPAFYTVFQELLQILETDSMDHILPAVYALKLKNQIKLI